MRIPLPLIALALFVLGTSGCGWMRPDFPGPPGPMQYQQYNATLHDPYTDNDLGPAVVGGRPREFQVPRAEPVRTRTWRDRWWNPFGGL